ncbi:MAG TPA: hypothetical protein VFA87_11830, partial [Rhizomicrobium sp.]|nr:hypothetical protein [Rhizomicrobium sp.]
MRDNEIARLSFCFAAAQTGAGRGITIAVPDWLSAVCRVPPNAVPEREKPYYTVIAVLFDFKASPTLLQRLDCSRELTCDDQQMRTDCQKEIRFL